jgi:manganese-dependent inorganic pyrophosphatase
LREGCYNLVVADTQALVVIGHKNPDTDSICSSIGYARFKSEIEGSPAIAYRAGNLNAQTRHVLKTFGAEVPEILTDIYPRIRDIMIPKSQLLLVRPSDPIAGARQLMLENRFSFLPIADDDDRPVGKLTALRLAGLLDEVNPFDTGNSIQVDLKTLAGLGGRFTYITANGRTSDEIPETVTGTVVPPSSGKFSGRPAAPETAPAIMLGRLAEIMALESACAQIVIATGVSPGKATLDRLKSWASNAGVAVLALEAGFSQTSAFLRLSQPVASCIEDVGPTFHADDRLREVLRDVNRSNEGGFIVLDAEDRIAGVVTRVNFMTDARFRVVLVDHNEFSQAVDGMEHAQISEIIDHHRIGGWSTSEPITFVNRAVGSTCTIVADIYRQSGADPSPQTAGLLLSGVLSDTVILRSPTTTPADRAAATWLAALAQMEIDEYGESMFEAGSEMQNLTPREIVELDLKYYEEEGVQFSVSQVEMTGFLVFWDRSQELCDEIEAHRARAGLNFAGLMVTDITHGTTLLVVSGEEKITSQIAYPQAGPHVYEMNDVLSRKKQVLPYLVELLHGL